MTNEDTVIADLSAVVAQAIYEDSNPDSPWSDLHPLAQYRLREDARPLVVTVAVLKALGAI